MGYADWYLNNISKAHRWRGNVPYCGGSDPHCWEGGVDIPLPPKTPIYALADGQLTGRGTFNMAAGGGFGYGVVTENVPGIGQVYYQHIELAPGLTDCKSGNCNGQTIQAGQLIGYSTSQIGEIEVGINSTWGGIWGTNNDKSLWPDDPRGLLMTLASNPTDSCDCSNLPIGATTAGCPPCQFKGFLENFCRPCYAKGSSGLPTVPDLSGINDFFSKWLGKPTRMLKLVLGIVAVILGLVVIFRADIQKTVKEAGKDTAKAVVA